MITMLQKCGGLIRAGRYAVLSIIQISIGLQQEVEFTESYVPCTHQFVWLQ